MASTGIPHGESVDVEPSAQPWPRAGRRYGRWMVVLAMVVVFGVLALLPGRGSIPPLLESDYCYQLIAVERAAQGLGFTSLVPVAPLQPWDWRVDYAFLTKWPIGYGLMVWLVRSVLHTTTIQACQWLALASTACALVGWFVWLRRCVPRGLSGLLVSGVGAGCAVSTAGLINVSTDMVVVAVLPLVLLTAGKAMDHLSRGTDMARRRGLAGLALAGVLCGMLFWVRYASLFVPIGLGGYLLFRWVRRREVTGRAIVVFGLTSAMPIVVLLLLNSVSSVESSVQAQLNLGHTVGMAFSFGEIGRAWWNLSAFGFYDYRPESHWVLALALPVVVSFGLAVRRSRRHVWSWLSDANVGLSTASLLSLVGLLVCATALFGGKYDYIGLDRYYVPARPIYFMLTVAPLLLLRGRVMRVGVCLVLFVAASWLIRQEWPRPYRRWLAAQREVAPSGAWAACFSPGAAALYAWLGAQPRTPLIVFSNFHEYITFETSCPALPIPPDPQALDRWVSRICRARCIDEPRVLFVLDANNRLRDYWMPTPEETVGRFSLTRRLSLPPGVSSIVYEYAWDPSGAIAD